MNTDDNSPSPDATKEPASEPTKMQAEPLEVVDLKATAIPRGESEAVIGSAGPPPADDADDA